MTRFTTPVIVLLLCGTALGGCASTSGLLSSLSSPKKAAAAEPAAQPADATLASMDVEGGVRQAQTQRAAGHYDDAIHTLSQVMLIASDDPRVVGEYGKTLAEKGRAQDAVQFLTRATELQPNEWSLYSALGVSYDQLGDQSAARMAYEHALKLKPGDVSVLNNYALSRMLANDPDGARALAARLQAAGGASDPKIARNIELVNSLAPASQPAAEPKTAIAEPQPAPVSAPTPTPVNSSPLPPAAPSSQNASAHPVAAAPAAAKVVMQPVPADPLAGPAKSATRAPTPLVTHAAAKTNEPAPKPEMKDAHVVGEKSSAVAKADAAKADTKTAVKIDVKPAASGIPALKVDAKADTKTATVKPEAVPVKAASDAKPDAKAPAKPASKTAIPALRQTASVY